MATQCMSDEVVTTDSQPNEVIVHVGMQLPLKACSTCHKNDSTSQCLHCR